MLNLVLLLLARMRHLLLLDLAVIKVLLMMVRLLEVHLLLVLVRCTILLNSVGHGGRRTAVVRCTVQVVHGRTGLVPQGVLVLHRLRMVQGCARSTCLHRLVIRAIGGCSRCSGSCSRLLFAATVLEVYLVVVTVLLMVLMRMIMTVLTGETLRRMVLLLARMRHLLLLMVVHGVGVVLTAVGGRRDCGGAHGRRGCRRRARCP